MGGLCVLSPRDHRLIQDVSLFLVYSRKTCYNELAQDAGGVVFVRAAVQILDPIWLVLLVGLL